MLAQRRPRALEWRTSNHFFLSSSISNSSPKSSTSKLDATDASIPTMEVNEFRLRGKELVDFIADYHLGLLQRPPSSPVFATSQALKDTLDEEPPVNGVPWDRLMADFSNLILPGVTPWQHPNFFAYFPHGHSFPSVCAELLSAGLGSVSFRNDISPSYGELEEVAMRWMGQLLDLPKVLTSSPRSAAIIMGSAGEAVHSAVVAARNRVLRSHQYSGEDKYHLLRRFIMFCSAESHLTVKRSAELHLIELRVIPVDRRGILCPKRLKKAIEEEVSNGRIPLLVSATIGTTTTCAIDPLDEIGPICRQYGCWLHVDGAYAGAACICPEYRPWLSGVEFADSLAINAHKWLLVHFDCSCVWMKDFSYLKSVTHESNTIYSAENCHSPAPEIMNHHLPFGRRFRALKLWLVLASYGVKGLQDYIRTQVNLALEFKKTIQADDRFEVTDCSAALVCFRLKAGSDATLKLESAVRAMDCIDVRSATLPGCTDIILRFAICSIYTTSKDVQSAAQLIKDCAIFVKSGAVKNVENGVVMNGIVANGVVENGVVNGRQ